MHKQTGGGTPILSYAKPNPRGLLLHKADGRSPGLQIIAFVTTFPNIFSGFLLKDARPSEFSFGETGLAVKYYLLTVTGSHRFCTCFPFKPCM